MLLNIPEISTKMNHSQALLSYILANYESAASFVKDRTGEDHTSGNRVNYQFVTRLLREGRDFSERNWRRLEDQLGINRKDVLAYVSQNISISGDKNVQGSPGSVISIGTHTDLEDENRLLREEIERLKATIKDKETIISLLLNQKA